jgi:hypothetical protein
MTPDTPASVPHRCAVEPVGLRPCPACGARQWRLGLVQSHCAQWGWREASTPVVRRGGLCAVSPSL